MRAGNQTSRVLVLGDDMRSFLAVVRSLGRRGIEVHAAPYDREAPALTSRYIRQVHHLPVYDGNGEAWCRAVERLVRTTRFDLVIPCCDRGLLMFDAHRERFGALCVAMPSSRVIELLFDKPATRDLARRLGIPTAKGHLLRAGDTAEVLAGELGLPLFLKPRRSYELRNLRKRRNVERLGSPAAVQALLGRIREPSNWLAEGSFEGTGVGVSVLSHEGRLLTAFQHRRLREPAGGGASSKRTSEALRPELLDAAAKICGATALTGVAMFEFREDERTRDWILVEVNARFWGSLPLPLALGVDFPRYLYDLLVEGKEVESVRYRTGVYARNMLINAYDVLFRNPQSTPRSLKSCVLALGRASALPWRWLRGSEVVDEFVFDDPRPGFQQFAHAARIVLRRRGAPLFRRASVQSRAAKL